MGRMLKGVDAILVIDAGDAGVKIVALPRQLQIKAVGSAIQAPFKMAVETAGILGTGR
jgi:hypothetical protein